LERQTTMTTANDVLKANQDEGRRVKWLTTGLIQINSDVGVGSKATFEEGPALAAGD
jgi:hypothetical protein